MPSPLPHAGGGWNAIGSPVWRSGRPEGQPSRSFTVSDGVATSFPDTGPAPEFRLSQARQGSTKLLPPGWPAF